MTKIETAVNKLMSKFGTVKNIDYTGSRYILDVELYEGVKKKHILKETCLWYSLAQDSDLEWTLDIRKKVGVFDARSYDNGGGWIRVLVVDLTFSCAVVHVNTEHGFFDELVQSIFGNDPDLEESESESDEDQDEDEDDIENEYKYSVSELFSNAAICIHPDTWGITLLSDVPYYTVEGKFHPLFIRKGISITDIFMHNINTMCLNRLMVAGAIGKLECNEIKGGPVVEFYWTPIDKPREMVFTIGLNLEDRLVSILLPMEIEGENDDERH